VKLAITGVGIVSCVGSSVEQAWHNITNGISGIQSVPESTYQVSKTTKTGYIKDFVLSKTFDQRWISKTDRHVQLALNATEQAVVQSGLDFTKLDPTRVHTVVGTCAGSYESIIKNITRINEGDPSLPNFIPGHINNMMSAYINMHYGIQGSGLCITGACAAGNQSIAIASMLIETGQADVVISGASDSWLSDVVVSGFESLYALSFDDILPRPFDTNRSGFAISEGAGILILESIEHAQRRGANVLAHLSSYAISSDAYHPTSPESSNQVFSKTVGRALHKAGINPDQINYINMHGTGTKIGDSIECNNMAQLFGANPFLSSTKSMTGHSIGSSSAIEAVIAVQSVYNNVVPGTINLTDIDPTCSGNHVTETIDTPVNHVLSNAFGFGGTNGAIIISKQ
jgi:3-oxoacyl-[acyl-carrier-protein] synthase II